jgi:iron(III) transport system ATP-binding protein
MRSGRVEQIGTPKEIVQAPRSEYVAEFTGFSNRLLLTRRADGWALSGDVLSRVRLPTAYDEVAVRLQPDDLIIAPPGRDVPRCMVTFPAEVVDSQFGGRHMDVILAVHSSRMHARIPLDSAGSWPTALEIGASVSAGFGDGALYYANDRLLDTISPREERTTSQSTVAP